MTGSKLISFGPTLVQAATPLFDWFEIPDHWDTVMIYARNRSADHAVQVFVEFAQDDGEFPDVSTQEDQGGAVLIAPLMQGHMVFGPERVHKLYRLTGHTEPPYLGASLIDGGLIALPRVKR